MMVVVMVTMVMMRMVTMVTTRWEKCVLRLAGSTPDPLARGGRLCTHRRAR